jgi:hypothetical protein
MTACKATKWYRMCLLGRLLHACAAAVLAAAAAAHCRRVIWWQYHQKICVVAHAADVLPETTHVAGSMPTGGSGREHVEV